MAHDDELAALHASDQRVVRSVDSLREDQWSEPSLLPGWTRAHVVAHLALNAEGFARAIKGLVEGEQVPVYDSNASRDADIVVLGGEENDVVRDRFFAATQHLRAVFGQLTDTHWAGSVNRLPDGPEWPVAGLVVARRTEVEVHHADLDLGYEPGHWPADFADRMLDRAIGAQAFAVTTTDLGRERTAGVGAPVVTGPAAELVWWLIGRGSGESLTATGGTLPEVAPWQGPPVH